MKKLLLIVWLTGICFTLRSQTSSDDLTGAQILRTARAIYDQGRLHELPGILEAAVTKRGKNQFSQSEKIEAYKLLILTYIYLEEPQKADDKMIALLKTDRFFELSPSDPIEFRNLYKKFRSNSLFRLGLKIGAGQTYQNVTGNYYVFADSRGKGEYVPKTSIQYTFFFEKDFKDRLVKWVAAPEVSFMSQAWTYEADGLYINDNNDISASKVTHEISQKRLQLSALVQYKFINKAKAAMNSANIGFYPYVSIGPAVSYLSSSNFVGIQNVDNKDVLTSESIDDSNRFAKVNLFAIASAGLRYKASGVYIHFDMRYQYSFNNTVLHENRYSMETKQERDMIYLFGYTPNDMSLNQVMINLGFSLPIFGAKKLIK